MKLSGARIMPVKNLFSISSGKISSGKTRSGKIQRTQKMFPLAKATGFTLIELMISLALGLLVLAAVSTIVVNTGKTNREVNGIARMQENGRYALARIVDDLRMAGAQYCSSMANSFPIGSFNRQRSLAVLADGLTMPWGLPARDQVVPAPAVGDPYPISPRYFIQGHECSNDSNCVPLLNIIGAAQPTPPPPGTAPGSRAQAADVLTVRYLGGEGVSLSAVHNKGSSPLTIAADVSARVGAANPPLNFQGDDLAMVADCGSAQVFEAAVAGTLITPDDDGDAGAIRNTINNFSPASDARVFNFTQDFKTVTYFLQIQTDPNIPAAARSLSTLMRQENGQAQPIVNGVERLEFFYAVEAIPAGGGNSVIRYLDADQVENNNGGNLTCLPRPNLLTAEEPGCLWRSVRNIEVRMLLNTVDDVAATATEPYTFGDDEINAVPSNLLPSGLPRGRMFRREFRTSVNVRNFSR